MESKDESESATSSLIEGDHIHNPRDLFIYLASQGFPIVIYVTWGKDTVSEMPRAAPFTFHPLTHQGLGSSRGLGVHCCYTVPLLPSISECLNPKLEALDQQMVREEKSLSSQSLLHTIHIPGLCPDQAYWAAAQRGKENPAPNPEFSKLPDLLKFSPTHLNDPDPF